MVNSGLKNNGSALCKAIFSREVNSITVPHIIANHELSKILRQKNWLPGCQFGVPKTRSVEHIRWILHFMVIGSCSDGPLPTDYKSKPPGKGYPKS